MKTVIHSVNGKTTVQYLHHCHQPWQPDNPVCKRWQGAQRDFRGRRNSAPNQGAERPGAAQFLFPNGIIVPGAAHFPSFSHLCPKISQSCPDFCPDCESCPNEISSKPAMFFSLADNPCQSHKIAVIFTFL